MPILTEIKVRCLLMHTLTTLALHSHSKHKLHFSLFKEDLSLSDLRKLVRLDEQRNTVTMQGHHKTNVDLPLHDRPAEKISPPLPAVETKKTTDKKRFEDKYHDNKELSDSSYDSGGLDFDMADDIIPLDETAESTLYLDRQSKGNRKNDQSDNEEEPEWLKKVATLVNAKAKKKANKTLLHGGEILGSKDSEASGNDETNINWPANMKAVPLLQIQKDQRHGCKVVNMKDKKRVVGQVRVILYCFESVSDTVYLEIKTNLSELS